MYQFKCAKIGPIVVCVLFYSLTIQASQDGPPDFTDVDDILLGQRHILRNDDLLIATDQAGKNTGSRFNNIILQTSQLKVSKQSTEKVIDSKCVIYRPGTLSMSVPINNVIHSRIGRVFALDHDVNVTLAPAKNNYGFGCNGKLGLYINDNMDKNNNSLTVVENSGPMWTQLLLADFNHDGYDDVFQNNGNRYAIHTAEHIADPAKGLKRVYFRDMPGDVAATMSPPVAGDFDGDGALDVAWLAAKPEDRAKVSIYLLSVCPRAGMIIRGVTCSRAFAVVPLKSTKLAAMSISTSARLAWPDENCSGCSNSSNQFWLAAGNFDGRYTAINATDRDELLFVSTKDYNNLEILAYRFNEDLKPMAHPKKTTFSNFSGNGFQLASGPINQFSSTDQLAIISVAGSVNDKTELAVFNFDSSLQAIKHDMNVSSEAFNKTGRTRGSPFATGIALGRFDPPTTGSARDFNTQIAVLYDTNDLAIDKKRTILHIYTVGDASDPKPKFRSEYIVAEKRFLAPHNMMNAAPLQAGDLRGRSLLLGDPDTFQVESHLQPSVILGSPPQHADFITPAKEDNNVVFNFSAMKKDFNSTYSVKATNENQSSNKSTTSTGWALAESASLKGKMTIGPVEIEGELRQSLDIAGKNTVGKTFNTFKSKSFDASTVTGFGDQVWYSSRRMNVYIYPVLGRYKCPNKQPECAENEKMPMTVVFSGPDNVRSNISATGRTLEWYQPVHVPGQLFTYPWNQQQLLLQNPELKTLSQTNTGAFFTDDSPTTRKVNWSGSSGENKSVGFNSSWELAGGVSVAVGTPEATYKDAGGIRGKVDFDMSYSEGLETLNTDSSKIGTSTGIAVKKPGNFPKPSNYQFLLEPIVFGSDSKIQQSQNIKPDADILTRGPLQTAFVADPTDANSGSWWSTSNYKKYIDVGFGFPARWEITSDKSSGLIDKDTACLGGECALMDIPDANNLWNSSFYWLRGFYIQSNGEGPQRTEAKSGDNMQLSVRVYNHSFKDMQGSDKIKVRFYGQQWDQTSNQPIAASQSFLIGQDTFQSLPGFASGTEPNWRLAHTNFDTNSCGQTSCAGKYFVFWTVVWAEDANKQIIMSELPGHGLNDKLSTAQLTQLLSNDSPNMQQVFAVSDQGLMEKVSTLEKISTSFSNNLGYFHQAFFIHDIEVQNLKKKTAKSAQKSTSHSLPQGAVSIQQFGLQSNRIFAGQELEITAMIQSEGASNSALQLMVYAIDTKNNEKVLLDHEIISHIKADGSYQIKLPIRPEGCGSKQIQVELDPGEPGQTGKLIASENLFIDC
ncbi:MAG: VCBS repeat-containing protein [Alcanivoracaceae bacterium]|nr:VCBS repeat-containing protein [Alcanivoracaceae bacterium]